MANEKRLIDANALKERAIRVSTVKEHCYMKAVGTHEIDKAPTVDAVEVVRCKDCAKAILPEGMLVECTEWHEPVSINGYCHRGKRKDK